MTNEEIDERRSRRVTMIMGLLKKQTERPKPTIAELEAMLNESEPPKIHINPDGSLTTIEALNTTVGELLDAIEASDEAAHLGYYDIRTHVAVSAIWLRREGNHVLVEVEHKGKFVEVIREVLDSHFSDIIEPAGICRAMLAAREEEKA